MHRAYLSDAIKIFTLVETMHVVQCICKVVLFVFEYIFIVEALLLFFFFFFFFLLTLHFTVSERTPGKQFL